LQVITKGTIEPVEVIGPVDAVDTAGPRAVTIQAKGGRTGNHIGITDEVWTARVTEAGAACVCVIRKQQGEIACQNCGSICTPIMAAASRTCSYAILASYAAPA